MIDGAERRPQVRAAIKRCVSWVSVSVDGTQKVDCAIRKPNDDYPNRGQQLKDFCDAIKGGPLLSARVTLQNTNIENDRSDIVSFIHDLGIDTVNFKFATGGVESLGEPPNFLIPEAKINDFVRWLHTDSLPNERGNNLAYLRRCFATKFFTPHDVSLGTPVKSYYKDHPTRCFTPFLFCLIDSTGGVYPCCHLYRDNHGSREQSRRIRSQHCLGQLRPEFDFLNIWRGKRFVKKRQQLECIHSGQSTHSEDPDFFFFFECTRHFQHNALLNAFYRAYKEDEAGFKEWSTMTMSQPKVPVWF